MRQADLMQTRQFGMPEAMGRRSSGSIKDLTRKFTDLPERLGISSFLIDDLDALAPVVEELAGQPVAPAHIRVSARDTGKMFMSRTRASDDRRR